MKNLKFYMKWIALAELAVIAVCAIVFTICKVNQLANQKEVMSYDRGTLDAINYAAVQNARVISDESQLMTHVSMFEFDRYANDGTVWMVYYANDKTTEENSSDTDTYLALAKFNIYSDKAPEMMKLLSVGDSIGDYIVSDYPPYDPTILVRKDDLLIVYESCADGKHALSSVAVDKQTAGITGYEYLTLSYSDETVAIDVDTIRNCFEEVTLNKIGEITDLNISTHFVEYNGYFYCTINDIFSASGYNPIIAKSTDCIHWEYVYAVTEYADLNVVESSLAIKDGLLYIASRTVKNGNFIAIYDLKKNMIVVKPKYIEFSHGCKPALINFNGKIILATNTLC